MNKFSPTHEESSGRGLQPHLVPRFREIELIIPGGLAVVDLIELYLGIDQAFSLDRGAVIQFVGAGKGAGSEQVALDMAWAAVSILGRKILLLNCTNSPWTTPSLQESDLFSGHSDALMPTSNLAKIAGHELYLADTRSWHTRNGALITPTELKKNLGEFSRYFDTVLLVSPAADQDPLGAVLARYVDGNVMVIEAEQTRRSAAIRLRKILSRSGRPILGAVLNDRNDYVPPWLARTL